MADLALILDGKIRPGKAEELLAQVPAPLTLLGAIMLIALGVACGVIRGDWMALVVAIPAAGAMVPLAWALFVFEEEGPIGTLRHARQLSEHVPRDESLASARLVLGGGVDLEQASGRIEIVIEKRRVA